MIKVDEGVIDAAQELAAFEAAAIGAGAIVSFSGLVRDTSSKGAVKSLHLQAYEPMTSRAIKAAADQANARWPLLGLCIHHRIGDIASGETIVFVAAASAHRRAAFEAADFLMDYLKTDAVFWKKEITDQGDIWIEPRADDYADSARWVSKK